MIELKTPEEIKIMAESGKRLHESVQELLPKIKAGITTYEIDKEAERLIRKNGAEPSFKRVKGYNWTVCVPINEQIVHTRPSKKRIVKDGDLFTLDIGAYYQGFHSDYATSFVVGDSIDPGIDRFLKVGKQTLDKAIEKAKTGHYIGEISKTIQEEIYGNGYFIHKELTGHGIGRELHEDPFVPGFLDRPVEKTYKMRPGLVIAIEIIYSMGTEKIAYEQGDDWSIVTRDGSLAACFEHTVAISDKNTCILT
ncbi:type I methionyl aminopeptidase [Candidatus Roizmanbacteria bacterium]|nr:type I methionyl aminopeptidase [Candidatus Roizmanbacteria bacterium]